MKFGKELKRQKVPEWIEAYIDYNGLKRILGRIGATESNPRLIKTLSGLYRRSGSSHSNSDIEEQAIVINALQRDGSRQVFNPGFLRDSGEEGSETEMSFFGKLDGELNKVNEFYKAKVEEVVDEANVLNKQLEALNALRIKVGRRDLEQREEQCRNQELLQVLEHVKMNSAVQSPVSVILSAFTDSKDETLSFSKEDMKKADGQLRVAFIEFYHKLNLLKHYSFMNLSAFSKILKKYDKVTSRRVSKVYMEVVDNSYLGNSDEISDLLVRTEATFVKNFANSDRREGMKNLRPKSRPEKHTVTFSLGFFVGFMIALLAAIALRIESQKLMKNKEGMQYFQRIFPLYSIFLYTVLHILVYAANIYYLRKYRINYPFIFGFKRGTELGYREVFLLGTGLAVLALSGFLANLQLNPNPSDPGSRNLTELIPLGLLFLVLVILFLPFNILYRSSRFFFIRSLFRCLLAPLYPVTFPDFFLADQLTSQMPTLRSLVLEVCYYGLGEYSKRQEKCHQHVVYNTLFYVIAIIPYWLRLMQCIRRVIDEKEGIQGYNALTYLSTIVAVLIRTAYELKNGVVWMVFALISSAVATIANTYWDIVYDWGLLRKNSTNKFLRDKLLVSHKSVYVLAMVLDTVLRLAWMQLVLAFNLSFIHKRTITTTVFCLEIIRRGIWNFFRLENEHLNNVGKYRAFRSVPLPFFYSNEEDGGDDDDDDKND